MDEMAEDKYARMDTSVKVVIASCVDVDPWPGLSLFTVAD